MVFKLNAQEELGEGDFPSVGNQALKHALGIWISPKAEDLINKILS